MKTLAFLLALACLSALLPAAPSLVVATPSLAEAPDEYRAGTLLSSKNPSSVRHLVLEDSLIRKKDKVTEALVAAASREGVMALLVSPAPTGTLAAFHELAALKPGLYRMAISPDEDLLSMEAASNLLAGSDAVGRAWALARTAALKGMAEIAFIPSSLPAFGQEEDARFKAALRAQCEEEGVLLTEKTPGQSLDAFLRERAAARPGKVMAWSQDSRMDPELVTLAADLKLFLAEGPRPSLLTDFAALAGLDPAKEDADYQKILKKAEKAIIDAGKAGRYSTWVLPQGWLLTLGIGRAVLEGDLGPRKAVLLDKLQRHFSKYAAGIRHSLSFRVDPRTGIRSQNHLLFREDAYILGKGFLSLPPGSVPKKLQYVLK